MKKIYRKLFVALLGLALLAVGNTTTVLAVEVERYTIDETIHDASAIFVGRVVGHESRWGDASHRWMMTDYRFQIDDAVLPDGSIQPGAMVTLSFWGGRIGEETHGISGFELPENGASYVMMLRPNWRTVGFTPAVAFNNGIFKIADDASTGTAFVMDADAQPLVKEGADMFRRRDPETDAQQNRERVSLNEFINYLRINIKRIKASAGRPSPRRVANDSYAMPTFAKRGVIESTNAGKDDSASHEAPQSPHVDDQSSAPPAPEENQATRLADSHSAAILDGTLTEEHQAITQWARFSVWRNLPIVINSFTDSFPAPWRPEDQYQMSKWNYYADIFRVRNPRTGTYAWTDNINDLAGWPSSADLQNIYGSPWDAGTLGVTFYRRDSSGFMLEADIALNPAFAWTVDDAAVYLGTTTARSYRRTMLHELGHVWGLDHQFNFLSVMNYSPTAFRSYCIPFMDDAEAVRATYPGALQNRTDLGTYMFRSIGSQNWAQADFPSTVVAGSGFLINNFHIENVGTTTINSPTLEFYLTTALNYTAPFHFLRTDSYTPALARIGWYNPALVGRTFTVPTNVAGGDYHVASFIRNDGGASVGSFPFSNNYGFTRTKIRVFPRVVFVHLTLSSIVSGESSTGRVDLGSAAGPGGLTVTLSSSDSSIARVPSSVFIPAGSASASFTINTGEVSTERSAVIRASSNGVSQEASLRVTQAAGFSLSTLPPVQTILGGESTNYTIRLASSGDFTGTATLHVSGLPSEANADFNPSSLTRSESSVMTVTTDENTPPGTYPLTITGTSGDVVRTTTVSLIVGDAPPPMADLALTATGSSDSVTIGSELTYTLTVSNNGPAPADHIGLINVLPPTVKFVSATSSQGDCAEENGVIGCQIGLLESGANLTLTIIVIPTSEGEIASIANVTSGETDPNPDNNTATITTIVVPATASADLSIVKTATPDPVAPGADITYTITVANNGSDAASSVTLTDDVPSDVTFQSVTTPAGWSCTAPAPGEVGTLTCTASALDVGATETFTMVVTVNSEVADGTVISNTANISATTADPDTSNNSATAIVTTTAALLARARASINQLTLWSASWPLWSASAAR